MPRAKASLLKRRRAASETVFVLGDRHSVVDFLDAPPLLPQILVADGRWLTFPELFRSVQRHLRDCALAEFAFEVQFFAPEDTALFVEVFGPACEVLHQLCVQWVRGAFDVVGVLLLCILLQAAVEQLAKEGAPILQEFFLK